ncbi:MAG: nucleoside kinase [Bacteroidales bacterium]|nr:nucleoside kinase [Bacteroidales bacterium]
MNLPEIKSHSHPESLKLSFRNLMEPLLVLFNMAASLTLKNHDYYIAYSIPGGVYGYFKDYTPSDDDLKEIREKIRRLIRERVIFSQELLPGEKIVRYFEHNQRPDISHLLHSLGAGYAKMGGLRLAHINGCGELFLNRVQENYEKLEAFRLFKFKNGFFLVADPDFFDRVMPEKLESSKYFRRFDETEETMAHLGISSIAELNDVIIRGELPEFIKISEAYQAKRISRIADNILSHPLKPRVIFQAGPTSSGKTTSANRLAIELKVMRKSVLILSLDNYYLPHSAIPDDPVTGMKNFELITALDLELFRQNINDLIAGKEVFLPRYYFDGQGAIADAQPTVAGPDTYVIVEGIHGLNPEMWKDVMDLESYRLYVSALSTLNIHDHLPFSTSDHRLIRRLVRDHLFRGYDFNETLKRWPDVMQNEYKSIFPFQESAHAIFNSALIYELAVFAHYAPSILKAQKAENEQIREEVLRLNRLLSLFRPIDPADIPPTSILREFIGGSSFKY